MSIETDLRTYLLAQAGISALISTRCYTRMRPQGTALPSLVTTRIDGGREDAHTLDGSVGFAAPRFQIDVFASTEASCNALCEQIRLVMQGYRGAMGSTTVGSVTFENQIDMTEAPQAGQGIDVYHTVLDYFIWYSETATSF